MNWRSKTFQAMVLFGVSGLCFLVPAVRSRDMWAIAAAITWLFGVVLFMLDLESRDR